MIDWCWEVLQMRGVSYFSPWPGLGEVLAAIPAGKTLENKEIRIPLFFPRALSVIPTGYSKP